MAASPVQRMMSSPAGADLGAAADLGAMPKCGTRNAGRFVPVLVGLLG